MSLPIVALVPYWDDEEVLEGAIDSVKRDVTAVVTLDGPYADVLQELHLSPEPGEKVWSSEVEKRNALLDEARRHACPAWGLMLDSDERAYNLMALLDYWKSAPFIEDATPFAWPILYLTRYDQNLARPWSIFARFKLFRYDETTRYLQGGFVVLHRDEVHDLSTDTLGMPVEPTVSVVYGGPYIVHRPDLRPLERRFLGTRRERHDRKEE